MNGGSILEKMRKIYKGIPKAEDAIDSISKNIKNKKIAKDDSEIRKNKIKNKKKTIQKSSEPEVGSYEWIRRRYSPWNDNYYSNYKRYCDDMLYYEKNPMDNNDFAKVFGKNLNDSRIKGGEEKIFFEVHWFKEKEDKEDKSRENVTVDNFENFENEIKSIIKEKHQGYILDEIKISKKGQLYTVGGKDFRGQIEPNKPYKKELHIYLKKEIEETVQEAKGFILDKSNSEDESTPKIQLIPDQKKAKIKFIPSFGPFQKPSKTLTIDLTKEINKNTIEGVFDLRESDTVTFIGLKYEHSESSTFSGSSISTETMLDAFQQKNPIKEIFFKVTNNQSSTVFKGKEIDVKKKVEKDLKDFKANPSNIEKLKKAQQGCNKGIIDKAKNIINAHSIFDNDNGKVVGLHAIEVLDDRGNDFTMKVGDKIKECYNNEEISFLEIEKNSELLKDHRIVIAVEGKLKFTNLEELKSHAVLVLMLSQLHTGAQHKFGFYMFGYRDEFGKWRRCDG